jgi:outer membrane immunogenic protein
MRKSVVAFGCLLTLAVCAAESFAADIPRRGPAREQRAVAPTTYNWTGAYIGINGGGAWGRSDFNAPFPSGGFDIDGGLIGATLGFNWQTGQWVLGVEGDLDWTRIRGSSLCAGLPCSTRNDWLGTVRGRLGYAVDRFMPYVTGGLALGNIDATITGIGTADTTKAGWTVGAGLESALWANWSAKLEYLYVDLGRGDSIAGSAADFRAHTVRAGLNYRF